MCADSSEPSLIAKAVSEFLLSQETLSLNKMTMGNRKNVVSLFDRSFFWRVDVL